MKQSKLFKKLQKENMAQSYIVAFATAGVVAIPLGFAGIFQWFIYYSSQKPPIADFIQLLLGVVLIWWAGRLQNELNVSKK